MKHIILALTIALSLNQISAQGFTLRTKTISNNTTSIELRSFDQITPTTEDYLTDLVFGIKWSSEQNLSIETVMNDSYNIQKSGNQEEKDGFTFQAFYASNTPFLIPDSWDENEWTEIARITTMGLDNPTLVPAEDGFHDTTNPNIGINLIDFSINSSSVLPVLLKDFKAELSRGIPKLYWETIQEINSDIFVLERRSEVEKWKSIASIDASNNTYELHRYSYLDHSAVNLIDNNGLYYRLKIVDMDGSFEYSDIRFLNIEKRDNKDFSVAPNPAIDKVTFHIENLKSSKHILFYYLDGRIAKKILIEENNQTIDISDLHSGMYMLVFEGGDRRPLKFCKR